ncbi:sugar transferase [Streptomyces tremellae]|uniref:Bacterial sugar transferase domain-containing protein n=1 Tax=Streptomyces tremellae TaxID=1124239 RepID=A0ABP7G9H6_9ACTN
MRFTRRPGPPTAPADRRTAPARRPARAALLLGERLPEPKRALDATLGAVLLALAAPLLAAAAAALALREGRVLVRQEVTGLGGRPFTLRSLNTRHLRLDLLSRLPEVVRGRLSLVGPAPLPVGHPRARAAWRSAVRPGLTGPAQLRRGSRMPWDEPALLDQAYVEGHWLGGDLALLARSCAAPARGRRHPRKAPRPGSRTVREHVTVSDTDHRRQRYIAAP